MLNQGLDKPEESMYRTARNRNTIAAYEEYLRTYPRGRYAGEARDNKNKLEQEGERQRQLAAQREQERQEIWPIIHLGGGQ